MFYIMFPLSMFIGIINIIFACEVLVYYDYYISEGTDYYKKRYKDAVKRLQITFSIIIILILILLLT